MDWYKDLGFEKRFWTVFRSTALLYAAGAAVSGNFAEAGRSLEELSDILSELEGAGGE